MGNRMSSLPIAQFCGRASDHDTGSGRAAAMSTAWHARCAGKPEADRLFALLTPEEQEKVKSWKTPSDVEVDTPLMAATLRYLEAHREITVCLDKDGCCPTDKAAVWISLGHCDFYWIVERTDGVRIAYVGDLKKSEFTTEDGPYSLQLAAYGFAVAAANSCDMFARGIWAAEEGRWTWEDSFVDLESTEAFQLWERVKAAILNVGGEYQTGPHCRNCYSRLKCPAHLIPPEAATGSIELLANADLATPEKVAELVLLCQRAKDTADKGLEFAKAWADRNGPVRLNGKEWRKSIRDGRESLDREALFKEMPEAAKFMKQGKPYAEFRWVKSK